VSFVVNGVREKLASRPTWHGLIVPREGLIMFTVRKILHPTDFSEQAERAFQAAWDLAKRYDAELTVLHVIPSNAAFDDAFAYLPPEPALRSQAERQLEAIKPLGTHVELQRHVVEGEPGAEIVHFAKNGGYELIVMGSHGRRWLSRLLLGSAVQDVLRSAPCPVLVIHPDPHALVDRPSDATAAQEG
jgi:universal stress protein A